MKQLTIEQVGKAEWQETTKEVTLSRTKDDGTEQSRTDIHNITFKEISLRIVGTQYDDDEGADNFITIRAENNDHFNSAIANRIIISTKGDQLSPESTQTEYYGSFEELKAAWMATVNAIWFGLEHTISRQFVYAETYRLNQLKALKG